MSPEQRKTASELLLHKRGIRINPQLHLTENDDEVTLRSEDELVRRMMALRAVVGTAAQPESAHYFDYFTVHKVEAWLSPQESEFLRGDERDDNDFIKFAGKRESLFFLAWCAGLIEKIQIPVAESGIESIAHYFPENMEQPIALRQAIRIRPKKELMDWSDLLYRLHWAVRHAGLIGKSMPGNLNGLAIKEWHQAVNWMTCYEEEDNWDHVSTETS